MPRYFLVSDQTFFVNVLREPNKKKKAIGLMIELGMDLMIVNKKRRSILATKKNMHTALLPENSKKILSTENLEQALRELAKERRCLDIRFLVANFKINISSQDSERRTALHWAAISGDDEAVDTLIAMGTAEDIEDAYGQTAKDMIIAKNAKADDLMNALGIENADLTTERLEKLLLILATKNKTEDLTFLLEHFMINVNVQDHLGYTALHWALLNNNDATAEILLNRGANINIPNADNKTANDFIIERQATLLRELGMDETDKNLEKALRKAAKQSNSKAIKFLLTHFELDIDSQGETNERTALHWAIAERADEATQLLIEHGASLETTDANKKTANDYFNAKAAQLMRELKMGELKASDVTIENLEKAFRRAAMGGRSKDVMFLLDNFGINIDCQDDGKVKRTALHWALYEKKTNAAQELIDRGARTDIKDAAGKTPSDLIVKPHLGLELTIPEATEPSKKLPLSKKPGH